MMEKTDRTGNLYSRMRLWELPDQYVAEPLDGSSGSCLAVNCDGSMTLLAFGSAQRLNELGEESTRLPLWRQLTLTTFAAGSIHSSYYSRNFQAAIGKDIIDVTLIARRCMRRNGTRMWRRGADADGYVANFVESEQIIQLKGYTASFVQFEILKPETAPRVAERHFFDLRKKYGNVLAIDLINTHGDEGRLTEKFATSVQNILNDDLRYFHFDFHKICGHVHFERLNILYDQIEDFLIKNRYYLLNDKGEKVETQIGIVRTNCVDCLDRTNVTHSMIGKKMTEFQLQRLGIFDAEETISTHPNFDDSFKILWANHGDDISIQYSGTPALKGDFVRVGRRTTRGVLKDGWNALMCYYLNNFVDGTKQDSVDLVQGQYIVSLSRDMAPTLKKVRIEAITPFPLVLGLILMGIIFAFLSLMRVRNDYWQLPLSIFWATMSIVIIRYVRANGRAFCNRPRLQKPTC
ncbi:hypothetical protein L1987_18397 [Smallanthus sonchifolius]|uniref:Uncharacterized protein n=1 Tax=Smallanthus sonchifolius TaxID=185202 RepID=A0ACB9IZM3_9ASTR|nr:hypothetical protein L1987_18397 [Smallanthus sonchifolius]